MQSSNVSYRGKYASESRKSYNNAVQQMHIQELQQKVDIILLHNTQLIQQNNRLKHLLDLNEMKSVQNKYSSSSADIYRLTRELQLKNLQIEDITKQNLAEKESIAIQLDDLKQVVKNLTSNLQLTIFQREQLEKKVSKFNQQKKMLFQGLKQELQNEMYQNSLKKQIEHKEQMRQKQNQLNKILQKKAKQWQDEKTLMQEQKMNTIINIQEKMEKQKQEIRKTMQDHFNKSLYKIQNQADQKCRKVRQHSENYIKTVIQQHKQQDQKPQEQLKRQIDGLRQSLDQRQKIIESLLKFQIKTNSSNPSYYDQVQDLRLRIKQLTQSFFRQSEILKVKMASKHQLDVQQTIKVYDNKIDILTERIIMLQTDNSRLRQNYQQEIRSKMKQRQRFQIQVSKLKNYIRKMKVQLQSYGKQMRLNIEGIRDQANSFSMSILGQLGQQKNKKNFYEQQIRKMREVIDLKQHEMQVLQKQNSEKFKYYQQKIKSCQQDINDLKSQLQQKDQKYKQQIDTLRQNAKQQLRKHKDHWEQQSSQMKNEILDLRKLTEKLQQSLKEAQIVKNNAEKQLQMIRSQLQQCKAHIDQLKLQMEMMGENNSHQQRNALKLHYERIIQQMQHDKQILKETNSAQSQQLSKLITKYKILQKSLQKTLSTMKKKTQLQHRVMQLGMDNNLVKNLSEVFRKNQEQKQNI